MKVKLLSKTNNLLDVIYTGATTCYNSGSPINKWFDVCTIETDKKIKLIDSCIQSGHHCYDEETEVFTEQGFKKWSDVTYNDKIGAFDHKNGFLLNFEKPKKIICEHYNGMMYSLNMPKINMLISPNHRLYCSLSNTQENRINPKFNFYKTEDIINNKKVINLPMRFQSFSNTTLKNEYNPLFLSDDKLIYFYKLFGFFIGDGYTKGGNILQFHLKKDRKIKYLKDICEKLNFYFQERKSDKYNVIYTDIGKFAKNNWYKDNEKYIPEIILKCSKNVLQNILDGLINSDGSITRNNSYRYETTSFNVANMVQSFFILTGYNATLKIKKSNNTKHKDTFVIQRCINNGMPHINDSRNSKSYIQKVEYNGKIYCAEVSSGLLLVRRGNNHTPYLSGNSVCEHSQFTFAIEGVSRVLLAQITRHRIGMSFSVQSQRYVEIKENKDELFELFDAEYQSKCNPEYYKNSKLYRILDKYFIDADNFNNVEGYYHSLDNYLNAIDNGEKPEDARMFLPNATKTNIVLTCNLRSLIHLCHERLCSRAQKEIRLLVKEMVKQVVKDEEWLKPYLVPKCEVNGFCNEYKCCGRKPSLKEFDLTHMVLKDNTYTKDKTIMETETQNYT